MSAGTNAFDSSPSVATLQQAGAYPTTSPLSLDPYLLESAFGLPAYSTGGAGLGLGLTSAVAPASEAPAVATASSSCAWWQTVLYGCGVVPGGAGSNGNDPNLLAPSNLNQVAPGVSGTVSGVEAWASQAAQNVAWVTLAIVLIAIGAWVILKP